MESKKQIRDTLEKRFSSVEIRELVDEFGFHYSEFESNNLKKEIFDIVDFFEKRRLLGDLWSKMAHVRPDILSDLPEESVARSIEEYLKKLDTTVLYTDITGYVPNFPRTKIEFNKVQVDLPVTKPIHYVQIGASVNPLSMDKSLINFQELFDQLPVNWLLLGRMGAGKTFWMLQLEQEMARITVTEGNPHYLPIYIDLSSPAVLGHPSPMQPEMLIDQEISRVLGLTIKLPHLLNLPWEVVLLFDEFDKLPDHYRRSFSLFFEKLSSQCRLIVACRAGDFVPHLFDAKLFHVSHIDDLSPTIVNTITHRLYHFLMDTNLLFQVSLEELTKLVLSPELQDWIRTPLDVFVALLSYAVNLPLAAETIQTIIKQRCLYLQISEWDSLKTQDLVGQRGIRWKDFTEALSYMAYFAYENGKDDLTIPIEAGAKRLVDLEVFQTPEKARRELLEGLTTVQKTGDILQLPSYAYTTNFKFRNKNVIEILAANHLLNIPKEAREKIITTKIVDRTWRPVLLALFDLLLSSTQLDVEGFMGFVLARIDLGKELKADDALVLLFASVCLKRSHFDLVAYKQQVIRLILKILKDVEQPVPLQTRIAIAERLGDFNDPRIGEMKPIPAGLFWRGFDQYPNDRPTRQIQLPTFEIDVYPVTNQQFCAFIEDGGYKCPEMWNSDGWKWVEETRRIQPRYWNDPRFNHANYPVVGVSWFEADAYARWAGKRLPTEAEWEKAARGENGLEWPWGNTFKGNNLNNSDSEELVHGTTPIGMYPAGQSPYGIFDMAGNVSEWVSDWYQPYEGNHALDSHYGQHFKVRRGGGWAWDRDFVRCTCRNASPRTADYAILGFRCAK